MIIDNSMEPNALRQCHHGDCVQWECPAMCAITYTPGAIRVTSAKLRFGPATGSAMALAGLSRALCGDPRRTAISDR